MTKILLLEDDVSLIDGLEYALEKSGYDVKTMRTVNEALIHLKDISNNSPYDLLLLDVTLPDGTGFDVCEKVRKENSRVPIIFLTASDEEYNVIRGLDSGADDYITKPFKIGELCSRIRALLRRTGCTGPDSAAPPSVIRSGGLTIDLASNRVTYHDKKIELTRAEYRLLTLLVQNADSVVTRDAILNELWDNAGNFVDDNTLSVHIRRLREKLELNPSRPERLITVRGFGYTWRKNYDA